VIQATKGSGYVRATAATMFAALGGIDRSAQARLPPLTLFRLPPFPFCALGPTSGFKRAFCRHRRWSGGKRTSRNRTSWNVSASAKTANMH